MLNEGHVERVIGLLQLFVKRNQSGRIELLVAKVTDDFLLGGLVHEIKNFNLLLQARFVVGKVILDDKIYFDGCDIEQAADGSINLSMVRYMECLKAIEISRSRKRERNQMATATESPPYRFLACTLMYLGNSVM